MSRYALLGDSYIARLERSHFRFLEIADCEIRYFGRGGMRASNVPADLWSRLVDFHPTHVFIHLGGNDITAVTTGGVIFSLIDAVVKRLKEAGVQHVFVGQVLPRTQVRGPTLTPAMYRQQARYANRLLHSAYGRYYVFTNIRVPKDLDTDGVHLNHLGMIRFGCKIDRAFKYISNHPQT